VGAGENAAPLALSLSLSLSRPTPQLAREESERARERERAGSDRREHRTAVAGTHRQLHVVDDGLVLRLRAEALERREATHRQQLHVARVAVGQLDGLGALGQRRRLTQVHQHTALASAQECNSLWEIQARRRALGIYHRLHLLIVSGEARCGNEDRYRYRKRAYRVGRHQVHQLASVGGDAAHDMHPVFPSQLYCRVAVPPGSVRPAVEPLSCGCCAMGLETHRAYDHEPLGQVAYRDSEVRHEARPRLIE
jgi:hypothetical protein